MNTLSQLELLPLSGLGLALHVLFSPVSFAKVYFCSSGSLSAQTILSFVCRPHTTACGLL